MEKTSGLGLPMILFLIFLILKLTDHITWSWVWVLSPIWISAGLVIFGYIFVFFLFMFSDN